MRDKKDSATLELPGFACTEAPLADPAPRAKAARPRAALARQDQLELLEATDTSGLPLWRRDENTDLTGLPIWAPA